jgi:hypothetical protein
VRKFFYVISGICGFVILFFVSAIISYYLFPAKSEKVSNIYASDESLAQLNLTGSENNTQGDPNALLTIVTPSLDGSKTVVRRGTLSDIIKKNDGDVVATEETQSVYEETEEEAPLPQSEKKAETPNVTVVTPSLNAEPTPDTTPEQSVPDSPNADESPAANDDSQGLNPSVRTSDTGL